jgi:hypothetical protein
MADFRAVHDDSSDSAAGSYRHLQIAQSVRGQKRSTNK